jgi:DNA-binding response OmpR family regulator
LAGTLSYGRAGSIEVEALMRILVAEDDSTARWAIGRLLENWGYQVTSVGSGAEAWGVFQSDEAPLLAILDWLMPGMDGLELCRKVRQTPRSELVYLILLTARSGQGDIVAGLESGADDYIVKPADPDELRARVQTGRRIVELQARLAARVHELEEARLREKRLQGLLPICSYCKKIRSDQNYWQQVEEYLTDHAGVHFSHGICPDCFEAVQNEWNKQ